MKKKQLVLIAVLALMAGACSKKEEESTPAAPPVESAAPAEGAAPAAAEAAPPEAPKRDWNAVVAEIAKIKMQRPVPDDKRDRMLQLQDELAAAAATDPAAREAYQNLSRILTGR